MLPSPTVVFLLIVTSALSSTVSSKIREKPSENTITGKEIDASDLQTKLDVNATEPTTTLTSTSSISTTTKSETAAEETDNREDQNKYPTPKHSNRKEKALPFFYDAYTQSDYEDDSSLFGSDFLQLSQYLDAESRVGGNKRQNSPIYYIRLPPAPYLFVPGVGYVSQPGSVSPLGPSRNPIFNVPVTFLSNGKPSNVYQPPTSVPMMGLNNKYPSGYLPGGVSNMQNLQNLQNMQNIQLSQFQPGYQPGLGFNNLNNHYPFGEASPIHSINYPQYQQPINHNQIPSHGYNPISQQGSYKPPQQFGNPSINYQPQKPSYLENHLEIEGSHSYQPSGHKPSDHSQGANSNFVNLPGKYSFNGKPNDVFVLRDSYNSLYADALQNFYP